jgi:uncharacterized protein (TIGR03086 family)
MHTIELLSCDARAVRASVTVVNRITAADLSLPTPCEEWDLGALLAHMTVQHRGFAAAAAGHGGDPGVWVPGPLGDDPVGAYAEAAEAVIEAFAGDEADFLLPEITPAPVPRRIAIGFHLVDYVVHGWDVASALGVGYEVPDDVVAAALPIAEAVPQGAARRQPGAAFAPALPDPGGDPLDRILAMLGRKP